MVSHTCGMGGDFLYFAYPLEGQFELECDGMVGNWAEANIGFGGLVFLGLHGGRNISIFPVGRRGETIARPDPPEPDRERAAHQHRDDVDEVAHIECHWQMCGP